MKKILITLCSLVLALASVHLGAAPLGTAFTYQGRLTDGANPANGTIPMVFRLWDDASSGMNVGSPSSVSANVTVANGLFSIDLDFGAAAFSGDARWLEIRVNGTLLTSRQRVAPTPNALYALTAGTVKNGAIQASQLGTLSAPASGQVLSYNGGSLVWQPGIWTLNGNGDAYYNGGKVGIGTTTPGSQLEVLGNWTGEEGALRLTGDKPSIRFTGGPIAGNESWLLHVGSDGPGNLGFFGRSGPGSWTPIMSLSPTGHVEILGQNALSLVGYQPFLTLFDNDNNSYAQAQIQDVGGNLVLLPHSGARGNTAHNVVVRSGTGNVGIGSPNPLSKLEVATLDGNVLGLVGYQPYLTLFDSRNDSYAKSRIQSAGGDLFLETHDYTVSGNPLNGVIVLKNGSGNVGIGTSTPQAKLDVNGNASVCSLTIRGGCDLAEPFQMSAEEIPKGAVVVIDEENAGKLKLSNRAYDNRVAGIVSGANGVNPGIALHQEGVIEGGQNVALSGRVYVRADASSSPIKPGDLLTTSNTLGHAMKVTDHAKAQGAIIGKAMSALKEGKGMVLVLVTLQ